jgi:tRNA threonylcarbamoyladenosine biosynthesis protein TsaE
MDLVVRTEAPAETAAAGAALATLLRPRDVIVLTGDLGAGKTTFTRGIAEGLGAEEHVQSPTFTLVREYLSGRLPVAHVDVYRLARIQDVVDLALEELDGGAEGVLVVEWGDAVEELLPEERLRAELTAEDPLDGARRIAFRADGAGWEERWDRLRELLGPWETAA